MKRSWFQDADGTFYRNIPLIMDERRATAFRFWNPRRFRELGAEFDQAWREGLIRKERLGRGDKLVRPAPFREAYPDKPGLWALDDL